MKIVRSHHRVSCRRWRKMFFPKIMSARDDRSVRAEPQTPPPGVRGSPQCAMKMLMRIRALVALPLLTIALTGCVVGGGLNYHFPSNQPPAAAKQCEPGTKDCDRPAERARP
jgi:hypothetical protein